MTVPENSTQPVPAQTVPETSRTHSDDTRQETRGYPGTSPTIIQDEFYWDVTTAKNPEPPIQVSAHSSNIPPEFIANTLEKISTDPYLKYLSVTVIDLRGKVKALVSEKVLTNKEVLFVATDQEAQEQIQEFHTQTVLDPDNNTRRLLIIENINTLATTGATHAPDAIDTLITILKNKQTGGYRVLLAKSFEEIIDPNVSKLYEYLSSIDLIKYSTYVDDQNGAYRISKVYRKF